MTRAPSEPAEPRSRESIARRITAARQAFASWSGTPLHQRLRVVRAFRQRIGDSPASLTATANQPWRASSAETLTAEILPLLDACRFLERRASRILAPKKPSSKIRPLWLTGTRLEVRRDPLGVILIIGPSNYPILLAGVQVIQALTAGNGVVVKPGRGGFEAMRILKRELTHAGLPEGVLQVLSEEVADARAALADDVDKVVLTGSATTGRHVLTELASRPRPLVAELSGCDAAIVRADADLDLSARAIAFGMVLNGGYTCIAPRRLYVAQEQVEPFERALIRELKKRSAVLLPEDARQRVATLLREVATKGHSIVCGEPRDLDSNPLSLRPILIRGTGELETLSDLAAPVAAIVPIASDEDALRRISDCPFRLGVSIFGQSTSARALALRVDAGVVVVNDMIVPTADPRVPFGGRGASGFGVTRGAEGLLEFTTLKSVISRSGRFRPHFDPIREVDAPLFEAFVQALHGSSLARRCRALLRMARRGQAKQRRDRREGESP